MSTKSDIYEQLEQEGLKESVNLVPAAGQVEAGQDSVHATFDAARAQMLQQADAGPRAVYQVPEALPLEYVERLLVLLDTHNVETWENANVAVKFDLEARREKLADRLKTQTERW